MLDLPEPTLESFFGTLRFQHRALIGRGAMGVVYHVHDVEMGRDVALKTLPRMIPEELYYLKGEFRALSGIVHTNLVELYDLVVDGSAGFFTMELVEGSNFVEHIGRPPQGGVEGPWLDRVLGVLAQLCEGVDALHHAGKLHRDIKPSNIMVTEGGRVVLLDFGLAISLERSPSATTAWSGFSGTPAYMSPEQSWGARPSPAADWYSVGVVLYEALTGELPFEGSFEDLVHLKERLSTRSPRQIDSRIPASLDALVMELLAPNPAERAGAESIWRTLLALGMSGDPPTNSRSTALQRAPFVGREAELGALRAAYSAMASGKLVIARLEGASGMGKTELLRQFVSWAQANERAVVLSGRCHPQESVPYKAFDGLVDALSRYLMRLPEARVRALAPRYVGELLRLFPVLGSLEAFVGEASAGEGMEPHEQRRRGFEALSELLSRVAQQRPLVLWIDDLQWGDEDSGLLLRELLSSMEAPMLFVLSYRSDEREQSPLINALDKATLGLGDGVCRMIEIGPLAEEDRRALCEVMLGDAAGTGEELLSTIAEESAGSPLFIGEMARHVAQAGGRPTSVRLSEVMKRRLDRLSSDEQRLLEVASIAGRPLERGLLLEAAGLGEKGRPEVQRLSQMSFLRITHMHDRPAVETYHDRIREAIVAGLSTDTQRARHRGIAVALEKSSFADSEALFQHWLNAGDRDRAAHHAIQAAERAERMLAFVRAAELFAEAVKLVGKQGNTSELCALQTRQADALVNVGRCREAALLYLRAARSVEPERDALDLQRKAAEQLLISGNIDEGITVLRSVLEALDIHYPMTPWRVLLPLLLQMSIVALYSAGKTEWRKLRLVPDEPLRIDLCFSAARGLMFVDALRGWYFSAQGLSSALRAGDQRKIAQGLMMIGGWMLIPAGNPLASWGRALMKEAERITDQCQDPKLRGTLHIARGQAHIFSGEWRQALEESNAGVRLLEERCHGITWERNIGRMGALRALEELGELSEYMHRTREFLRIAQETGDIYAQVTARLYHATSRLANDSPSDAREEARRALDMWSRQAFHIQHLYALRIEAHCDLYEHRTNFALQRVEEAWPAIERANFLRISMTRIDALLLRARVALAIATESPHRRDDLIQQCSDDARRLSREERPDCAAHALLLLAGIAASTEDQQRTLQLLDEAIACYRRIGMRMFVEMARHRKGTLLGGEDGLGLRDTAEEWMSNHQILRPLRWLAVYAPGFRT